MESILFGCLLLISGSKILKSPSGSYICGEEFLVKSYVLDLQEGKEKRIKLCLASRRAEIRKGEKKISLIITKECEDSQ